MQLWVGFVKRGTVLTAVDAHCPFAPSMKFPKPPLYSLKLGDLAHMAMSLTKIHVEVRPPAIIVGIAQHWRVPPTAMGLAKCHVLPPLNYATAPFYE